VTRQSGSWSAHSDTAQERNVLDSSSSLGWNWCWCAARSYSYSYYKLHGLLAPAEQKELADEERAWLVKRDAIKSQTEKDDFIQARREELQRRAYNDH
jgi:hypothetical protein